ncbi:MAG: ankyrin repeat domain-containing protein [Rubripirellula sp.]
MKRIQLRLHGHCFLVIVSLLLTGCSPDPDRTPEAVQAEPIAVDVTTVATENSEPADLETDASVPDLNPPASGVSISADAFRMAAEKGRVEKIQEAISAGVDVDGVDGSSQFGALHLAAHEGHLPVVKLLLQNKATVDLLGQNDLTPLHLAAYNGHTDVVALLIKSGAKVDPRDREGKTPLLHACTGPFEKSVKLLVESGADINVKESTESFTPLMTAAGLGEIEVVKVLLRNDADKAAVDQDGDTALSHAQTSGHTDIIKLLE